MIRTFFVVVALSFFVRRHDRHLPLLLFHLHHLLFKGTKSFCLPGVVCPVFVCFVFIVIRPSSFKPRVSHGLMFFGWYHVVAGRLVVGRGGDLGLTSWVLVMVLVLVLVEWHELLLVVGIVGMILANVPHV